MIPVQQSFLKSNRTTRELEFDDFPKRKDGLLEKATAFALLTATWPLFFIAGGLFLALNARNYIGAKWNQSKLVTALSDSKHLEEYSKKRLDACEKQIKRLKHRAIIFMDHEVKKLDHLHLPIPKRNKWNDYFANKLPDEVWKDFQWNKFLETDFLQTSSASNKTDLKYLDEIKVKLRFLLHQKDVLTKLEGKERIEAIKRIAEFGLIKSELIKQNSKEWIVRCICWMVPTGIFWDLVYSTNHARQTYEGNKKFLPPTLNQYADLIDAHNQLMRNHDFLVPYIP